MKTLIALLLFSFNSFAVEGLTIPNSHQVDQDGYVFRGKEPRKLLPELADFGITDVIIFKNDTKGEVVKEIAELEELGITSHHIPFKWKEYPSMREACEQLVKAINIIHRVKKKEGMVFFHCTAGEDRTGALAGLFRMLEEGLTTEEAFRDELCKKGYSDGNPHKPYAVHNAIQKELTPLFLALAKKVEDGEWKLGKLSKKSCQNLEIAPSRLRCRR